MVSIIVLNDIRVRFIYAPLLSLLKGGALKG
jgi:hypothetical protein